MVMRATDVGAVSPVGDGVHVVKSKDHGSMHERSDKAAAIKDQNAKHHHHQHQDTEEEETLVQDGDDQLNVLVDQIGDAEEGPVPGEGHVFDAMA